MNLLGLAGRAGAGKDTAADVLVERFGFTKVALADPMKRACAEWFDWSSDTLWGPSEMRNQSWDRLGGLTARKALQTLGTEFGRACYENVWVDIAIRTAKVLLGEGDPVERGWPHDYDPKRGVVMSTTYKTGVVISDVRFANEVAAIRAAGGKIWLIERPGAGLSGAAGAHKSEHALGADFKADAIIMNDNSIESLRAKILAAGIHSLGLEPRE